VALGKGNQAFDADFFGEAGKVTAPTVFQCHWRVLFNFLLDRSLQVPAQHVSFGMVVMGSNLAVDHRWCLRHSRHIVRSV
jgi:hypothetical protein